MVIQDREIDVNVVHVDQDVRLGAWRIADDGHVSDLGLVPRLHLPKHFRRHLGHKDVVALLAVVDLHAALLGLCRAIAGLLGGGGFLTWLGHSQVRQS